MSRLTAFIALVVIPSLPGAAQSNLLTNPGAEMGATNGWVILENGGGGWTQSAPPLEGSHSFGTSTEWCRRYQIVDLLAKGYDPAYLDSAPEITVRESFVKIYQSDQCYMRVILLGADDTELDRWDWGSPEAAIALTNGPWEEFSHVFRDYPPGVRRIYWEDGGDAIADAFGPLIDAAYLTVENRLAPTISTRPGASDITVNGAILGGSLVSTGAAATAVSVYWGLADGGTNAADWSHAAHFPAHGDATFPAHYATNVTGLLTGRMHFYRYAASNSYGVFWSREASALLTGQIFIEALRDEAVEGGAEGCVRVGRPGTATNGPLTVTYTLDGSALPGTDFLPLDGTLTLPTGATHADVPIVAIDDFLLHEPVKTARICLNPGPYVPSSLSNAVVRVIDNDTDQLPLWQYRCKIAFPGYQDTEPLTNFPALIIFSPTVTGFSYGTFASTRGTDLRFADHTETRLLPYDIEDWHDAKSNAYVWVRVPLLESPTNYIWAYWGNPESTTPPFYTTNGQTWSQGYRGVWHFAPDETNVFADVTANGHDAYNYGSQLETAGTASSGRRFRGLYNDYIRLDGTPSSAFLSRANTPINISCWVKPGVVATADYNHFLVSLSLPTGWPAFGLALGKTDRVYMANARSGSWYMYSSTNSIVSSDTWTFLTAEYSGSRYYLSANAQIVWATGALTQDAAGSNWAPTFGSLVGAQRFYDGAIDEVRIADFRSQAEWVWAEMMTMASNSVFTAYGPVERRRRGTVLVVH